MVLHPGVGWSTVSSNGLTVSSLVDRCLRALVEDECPRDYAELLLGKLDEVVARRDVDELAHVLIELGEALRDSVVELAP